VTVEDRRRAKNCGVKPPAAEGSSSRSRSSTNFREDHGGRDSPEDLRSQPQQLPGGKDSPGHSLRPGRGTSPFPRKCEAQTLIARCTPHDGNGSQRRPAAARRGCPRRSQGG
jgi:hypothetical protein